MSSSNEKRICGIKGNCDIYNEWQQTKQLALLLLHNEAWNFMQSYQTKRRDRVVYDKIVILNHKSPTGAKATRYEMIGEFRPSHNGRGD